jgi:hypothetical protein
MKNRGDLLRLRQITIKRPFNTRVAILAGNSGSLVARAHHPAHDPLVERERVV